LLEKAIFIFCYVFRICYIIIMIRAEEAFIAIKIKYVDRTFSFQKKFFVSTMFNIDICVNMGSIAKKL